MSATPAPPRNPNDNRVIAYLSGGGVALAALDQIVTLASSIAHTVAHFFN